MSIRKFVGGILLVVLGMVLIVFLQVSLMFPGPIGLDGEVTALFSFSPKAYLATCLGIGLVSLLLLTAAERKPTPQGATSQGESRPIPPAPKPIWPVMGTSQQPEGPLTRVPPARRGTSTGGDDERQLMGKP